MAVLGTEPSRGKVWVGILLLALICNGAVLWSLESLLEYSGRWIGNLPEQELFQVSMIDEAAEKAKQDKERIEKKDTQIVQNDYLVDERPPEEKSKRESEFDNRVKRETVARNGRPDAGATARSRSKSKAQSKSSRSRPKTQARPENPRPKELPERKASPERPRGGDLLRLSDRGNLRAGDQRPFETEEAPAQNANPASSSHSAYPKKPSLLANSKDLARMFGRPGTMQDIKEVEEGDATILNTRRNRYASFFNRVRDAIARHWHPAVLHSVHDPYGKVYGNKDRVTKVMIQLKADGSVLRVRTENGSGVDYLDQEAVRSIWAAQPFANPPADLVDPSTGRIDFRFMFTLEIGGRARIFRFRN